ncbi:MAG: DUF11 domain-containing protein [Gammaproteobacteria bacterium]|nr:DUF11 domain-containing protein [Gammaproteobacteria bacterium]
MTWRLTVTNTSTDDEDITNVEVTDVLGAGFQYVSSSSTAPPGQIIFWDKGNNGGLGSIPVGVSVTIDITAKVIATQNLENRADVRFGANSSPVDTEFDSAVDGGTANVVYSAISPRVSSITR